MFNVSGGMLHESSGRDNFNEIEVDDEAKNNSVNSGKTFVKFL